MTSIVTRPFLFFLTASLLILGLSYLIIQSGYYLPNTDIFSLAITIDIVFFIPLIYFLFIRKRKISKITIIPVIALSYLIASFLLPANDHTYLEMTKKLLVPLELIAVGFIVYKVRLTAKSTAVGNDFVNNLRNTLHNILGESRITDFFTTEISIFYYGLFGWTGKQEIANGKAFTYHKRSGYSVIVGVFFFLILIETLSLHLLISQWRTAVAWIFTSLSAYGVLFLFADLNAARKRPVIIDDHSVQIRIGFRWMLTIPFKNMSYINKGFEMKKNDKNFLRLVLIGSENIIIGLKEPVEVKGLYGISKTCNRLGLFIDNKEEFYALINAGIRMSNQ